LLKIQKCQIINLISYNMRIIGRILVIVKTEKSKQNYEKYIKFGLGTLLSVSEVLPFVDTKYNGILHMVNEEFKRIR
jgi:uncharacterized membrane protein